MNNQQKLKNSRRSQNLLYKQLPGVPDTAAAAPGNVRTPLSFKNLVAKWAAMDEAQTLCFHIKSLFLIKSSDPAFPPAHPPATLKIPSNLSSCSTLLSLWFTFVDCVCQSSFISTRTFACASKFSLMSIEPTHFVLHVFLCEAN
jgi:hypothetical protein